MFSFGLQYTYVYGVVGFNWVVQNKHTDEIMYTAKDSRDAQKECLRWNGNPKTILPD